jgi:hypothetical protein
MIMDKQRENDIQELCKQVLEECYPSQDYNRGSISCPFCGNESYGDEMDDIKHDGNCAYLIAKDLSTNGG